MVERTPCDRKVVGLSLIPFFQSQQTKSKAISKYTFYTNKKIIYFPLCRCGGGGGGTGVNSQAFYYNNLSSNPEDVSIAKMTKIRK